MNGNGCWASTSLKNAYVSFVLKIENKMRIRLVIEKFVTHEIVTWADSFSMYNEYIMDLYEHQCVDHSENFLDLKLWGSHSRNRRFFDRIQNLVKGI